MTKKQRKKNVDEIFEINEKITKMEDGPEKENLAKICARKVWVERFEVKKEKVNKKIGSALRLVGIGALICYGGILLTKLDSNLWRALGKGVLIGGIFDITIANFQNLFNMAVGLQIEKEEKAIMKSFE
jgi:hypothetical protein